ncbi:hypothetical protein [Lactiplantibacillus plantarum]|uniref:hypothetical protein n=1 Tax=Lactiplantibacillus plantarum TaxID=1590 RepID=UPI00224009A3|nr:hypothetical protein [Lactiplantibacillus plantarum]
MFGKNRTAPVPAHGKHSLSLKTERVRISDEVLDSIVDQVEAHMLKRSKGKLNKVIKGPDKRLNNGESGTDKPIATKQPRVRIEFDDIADTPKVFVDGVEQEYVQRIDLSWNKFGEGCYQIEV